MIIEKNLILILGKGTTQGLDNTAITAEAQNYIYFTRSKNTFCLNLHCSDSFLYVNDIKIYQFKLKILEIKPHLLCFCWLYNTIDFSDVVDILKYLMKKHKTK